MISYLSRSKLLSVVVGTSLIGNFYYDTKRKNQSDIIGFITNSSLVNIITNHFMTNFYSYNMPLSFDTKGLPTNTNSFRIKDEQIIDPLTLIAVGNRRKNLYIVEVDVYQIGISFSNDTLKLAKEWNTHLKNDNLSLVGYIFDNMNSNQSHKTNILSATLKFYRNVGKTQFLNAFDDAFNGCDSLAIIDFKNTFSELIPEDVKAKDEFIIYWLDNGAVVVSKNGIIGNTLYNKELNKRLLEVYIDPSKTVSMELFKSLESNIKEL